MLRNFFHKPTAGLQRYVQFYSQREVSLRDPLFVQPVPARAAPMLEFIYGDKFKVIYTGSAGEKLSPATVVVGMLTRPHGQLRLQGRFTAFVIVFQPTGMDELFPVCLRELTNRDDDARIVLGRPMMELEERLGECDSFAARVRVTDAFLMRLVPGAKRSDPITMATRLMVTRRGCVTMPDLAGLVGLSQWRLEREFAARLGVRPKLYARIVRFQAALDSKVRFGTRSWTDVSHEFGYYDQMHLIHDFEEFTGGSPTENLRVLEVFFREQIRMMQVGMGLRDPHMVPRFVI